MSEAPSSRRWAFEDLEVGTTLPLGPKHVTAEEIVAFAGEFDPQPMHLDEAAARESLLGGLAASGWHVCAMFMRMMCDSFLLDSTSQGAPGVDHVRWIAPVKAGDTLSGRSTVLSRRVLKSRPGLGLVQLRHELSNQDGLLVFETEHPAMFRLRQASGAEP